MCVNTSSVTCERVLEVQLCVLVVLCVSNSVVCVCTSVVCVSSKIVRVSSSVVCVSSTIVCVSSSVVCVCVLAVEEKHLLCVVLSVLRTTCTEL